MKKKRAQRVNAWLPFLDSRILPDIISFGCVKGPCRFFLQIEIILALFVVIGTCIVVISKFLE